MTTIPNKPRFLVAGTAISETVVHQPGQRSRHGLGGVAATMAMALAQAGNEVTLVTTIGAGPAAEECRRILEQAPFHTVVIDRNHAAGQATILTQRGEQRSAKGNWPKVSGIAKTVVDLAPQHDCVLVDSNIEYNEFRRIVASHETNVVNATTIRSANFILRTADVPKAIATMNRAEARTLAEAARVNSAQEFLEALGATTALVTLGPKGWLLHRKDQPDVTSPAAPVPSHTDFVGCGDYATAGLAHAALHGTDPVEGINAFVTAKLAANRLPPND